MPLKDYYQILGVDKNADADTIKTAYRNLAKEHHPDANKGDRSAEKRFTEINEAYDVLGSDGNRRKYDSLVEQERTGRYHPPGGRNAQGFDDGVDWDAILSSLFGWEGGSYAAGHGGGFSFESFSRGDASDPFFGTDGVYTRNTSRKSLDVENTIRLTLREAYSGAEKTIRIAGKDQIRFRVPAGIRPGERIRLEGMGDEKDGRRGDRYLKVELTAEPGLSLDGLDVTLEREIAPWDAALGTSIKLSPLKDELTVKVQPGTRGGVKLRVRGQGYRDRDGNRGDLFVMLTIQNPDPLPEAAREAYRKLRK